ncbi:MAG TPA: peptidoglycan-binding domain-containing protein [Candidatus Paceibacterota bacterium]|nr:peptidoglycan-binding domain-containing protein [Candidatus Paceibacterota bacterium]
MLQSRKLLAIALTFAGLTAAAPAFADHNYRGAPTAHTPRCVNLTKAMSVGSTNGPAAGQVSLVQDFLSRYGYYHSSMTGYFGHATAQALRAFQADHGLLASGSVDASTQAYVHALTCSDEGPLAGGPEVICSTSQAFCPYRSYAGR